MKKYTLLSFLLILFACSSNPIAFEAVEITYEFKGCKDFTINYTKNSEQVTEFIQYPETTSLKGLYSVYRTVNVSTKNIKASIKAENQNECAVVAVWITVRKDGKIILDNRKHDSDYIEITNHL